MKQLNLITQQNSIYGIIQEPPVNAQIIGPITPTEEHIQLIIKAYDNNTIIIASDGFILYNIGTHLWIFYDTGETATTICNRGNYNYTHKDFIKSYQSEPHGIIATLVLLSTIATTQNRIFYNLHFVIHNQYAFNQVSNSKPVQSVYGFS